MRSGSRTGVVLILVGGWSTLGALAAETASPAQGGAAAAPRVVRRHVSRALAPGWAPAGFGGGGAFIGITFDRAHPGVVYASSDVAGVFRSTDYGEHWEMRSVGLGNLEVSSLAVDPFDLGTLYAGVGAFSESSRSGIYVSHDAGSSWQLLPATNADHITFRRMRTLDAIAPDRTLRGVIVAGTRGNGIWRTTDGGTTWTQVLAAPPTSAPVFQPGMASDDPTTTPYPAPVSTIAFAPDNPAVVYAALDGVGVYRSATGGTAGSWRDSSSGIPAQSNVRDLAVSTGGNLYAAAAGRGVFRSADGGASWVAVNGNLPLAGVEISSVAVHPTNPLVAYAALVTYDYPSVWRTADGGATWAPQGDVVFDVAHNPTRLWDQGQTYAWQVRLDPSDPQRLFYVDFWGINRSDGGAATTTEKIVGAQDTCVSSLFLDTDHPPDQPDTLYATQWDDGVVASVDKGATWTAVQPRSWDPQAVGHYWSFAVAHTGGSKVYLTGSTTGDPKVSRIWRSTDTREWTAVLSLPTPPAAFVETVNLTVDPTNPARVYAAVAGDKVYVSTDGGASWAPTGGQPGDTSFTYALAADGQGRVFVGTLQGGLFRSTDRGATWSGVLPDMGSVFRLAATSSGIYAAGAGATTGLYRSGDGGGTWLPIPAFPPLDDGDGGGTVGMGVAVDPADGRHLFLSVADLWHNCDAGAGVAESSDGGVSWRWINSGLGLLSVGVLVVAPDGTVYAGTSCGSVWRRNPG